MEKIDSIRFVRRGAIYFAILFFLPFINISYIYAEGPIGGISSEADAYRTKGYEAQQHGDIDTAIEWYQKAANLKPAYASPHNDLGILFETKGWLDRAEAEYKKALILDPNYKEVHTNLALLYERKGELEKAAFHWMRRYRLGNLNDPWTQEARVRLEKLGLLDKIEKTDLSKIKQQAPVKQPQKKEKPPKVKKEAPVKKPVEKKQKPEPKPKVKKEPPVIKPVEKKVKPEPKPKVKKEAPVKKPVEKKLRPETKPKIKKEPPVRKPVEKKVKPEPKPKVKKEAPVKKPVEKKQKPAKSSKSDKKDKNINKELQESLRLAEERLRKEKDRKENVKAPEAMTDIKVDASYSKAKDYYNKGEYAKALDVIRLAKQGSKDSKLFSELEDEIKVRMKEERIEDHYKEGVIHYRQKDFTGAKKEFEAILSILPE